MAFPMIPLGLAWLWRFFFARPKPGPVKNAVYECGLVSTGDTWVRHKVHYYLFAIVFLIVDVEVVFLIPFAMAFSKPEVTAAQCVVMLLFVLLLAEGLVWAWCRKFLEWK